MNEIVDQLRENNQAGYASIELPDEDQLVLVQEQILLHLPADLKDFLLSVSDVVYGAIEPVTVSDENLVSYLPEMTFVAWDRGLPRDLIPICEYQQGYYFIAQEGYISTWSPANGINEGQHWDSIWDWCENVWLAAK
jgi:hypothetical protein